jgi:outer membrane receptor protein involved in Fe transport
LGNWSAGYRFRYIGAFRMGSPSPSQDVHPAGGSLDGYYIDYAATWYHDISAGYEIKPLHTRVDLGVNNLFNKQPPILYANNTNNANSIAGVFDYLGRYYWARVTVSF